MERPDRSWLVACVVLILVPLLFYAPMVFRGWEPPSADTQSVKPFGVWGLEMEKKLGTVPSWYPYIFSGMPSYGSFIYTPRSPLNPMKLLTSAFAGSRGARYVLFFALAGIGTALLARRHGASWIASTGAGLFFAMTPYVPGSVQAGHATKLEALALVPFFLLALELLIERPDLLRAGFLALCAAVLAWAHHPQIAYYGILIGGLYALGRVLLERRPTMQAKDWAWLLGLALLATLVAGALVAEPYLGVREYAGYSIRGGGGEGGASTGAGWDYATAWSFHPLEAISFVFPGWFGLRDQTYWGMMPFTHSTHYFGLIGLLLALPGGAAMPKARRITWTVCAAVVLLIGFGRHLPVLYGPMYAAAPLFNKFRVPSMIYAVLPLTLAPMVALGIDRVVGWTAAARAEPGRREARAKSKPSAPSGSDTPLILANWPRVMGASFLALLLSLLLGFGLTGSLGQSALFLRAGEVNRVAAGAVAELSRARFEILRASVWTALLLVTLLTVVIELGRRKLLGPRQVAVALVVLLAGDLIWIDRKFFEPAPPASAAETFPARGAAQFLASQPGPFRVLPLGSLFTSNGFGLYGVESVGGYQPAKLRAYQDLLDSNAINSPAVLRMLGVRFAVSGQEIRQAGTPAYRGEGFVYDLGTRPDWVWGVTKVETIAGGWEQMSRRFLEPSFNPTDLALLYDAGPKPTSTEFVPATITNLIRGQEEMSFQVESTGPAFVVTSEIYYQPGWSATIDGSPATIYRADHLLRAVEVPAGSHRVSFRSTAKGFRMGERVSRVGGLVLLVLLVAGAIPELRRPRRA